jgi:thiol-disulfide isomerase/thioredoxin
LIRIDLFRALPVPLFAGIVGALANVFALWCGSCRYEHPFLTRAAEDKRFMLVDIDWKEEIEPPIQTAEKLL